MNMLADLLSSDGYIVTNKTLIKKFGLHSAVLIGELCAEYSYWGKLGKLDEDDSFYSTRENIEENTGLNEHFQRKALAELKEQGIVSIVKKGMPAVNYYKIHYSQLLKILTSSAPQYGGLDVKNMEINNNNNTSISKDIEVQKKNKEKTIVADKFLRSANSLKESYKEKEIDKFVNMYHEHCPSLSKVRALTDKRKKAIQYIVKQYGWDNVITVFDLAEQSDFLKHGTPDGTWKGANIDFFLREDKFVATLEGKYGGSKKRKSADGLVLTPKVTKEARDGRKYHF